MKDKSGISDYITRKAAEIIHGYKITLTDTPITLTLGAISDPEGGCIVGNIMFIASVFPSLLISQLSNIWKLSLFKIHPSLFVHF